MLGRVPIAPQPGAHRAVHTDALIQALVRPAVQQGHRQVKHGSGVHSEQRSCKSSVRCKARQVSCKAAHSRSAELENTGSTAIAVGDEVQQLSIVDDPHSQWWEWDHPCKPRVHFWRMGEDNAGPPVLLLHGFGVGCFHFEDCMHNLAQQGHRVWAMDFIGQGRSWPREPHGLAYSVDLWTEQVKHFVEENIGEAVFVVGNSLGGFVAASFAALHPRMSRGIVLANATPWWAFTPAVKGMAGAAEQVAEAAAAAADVVTASEPQYSSANNADFRSRSEAVSAAGTGSVASSSGGGGSSDGGSRSDGSGAEGNSALDTAQQGGWLWGGTTPAPGYIRSALGGLWQRLRSNATIQTTLRQVYAREDLVDDRLADRILEAAAHPLAFDAFLSILFAPKSAAGGLDDMLLRYREHGGRVLLVYGREDPWVRSIWGQRIVRVIPEATYLQLSPSGHCPHAEAPALFARSVAAWVAQLEGGAAPLLPLGGSLQEGGVTLKRVDDSPSNALEYVVWAVYTVTTSAKRAFNRLLGQLEGRQELN